jgi:ribosomal protein S18 acetylase RimI-like enzyme
MRQQGPRARAAGPADVAGIVEIETEAFPGLTYPEFFLRQAVDAGLLRVVVEADGLVSGYALVAMAPTREGWLLSMAVTSSLRGAGVGSKLIADAVDQLAALGATEVRLTVGPNNTPAIRLYERHGFEQVGEHADYFGPGEGRLVLRKVI